MSSVDVKETEGFKPEPIVIIAASALAGVFVWTYFDSLTYLYGMWFNPDYQHGFFVLPFCAILLWYRRDMMKSIPVEGSWWGLAVFALSSGIRLYATYMNYAFLQQVSMIPAAAAIVLFVGGWRALHWAWPAVLFMIFMIPLPAALTDVLSQQLQAIGSRGSVFVIQTIGIPAMRSGNVIQLREMPLNVAEACSGIRMLMLFFALCVGGAFMMTKKMLWERMLIVVSAVPIAIVANVFRLTMTAVFAEIVSKWPNQLLSEEASKLWPGNFTQTWAHDVPGLMMMPAGLILLWIEWTLLTKLFIEESSDRAAAIRGTTRGLLPMSASPGGRQKPMKSSRIAPRRHAAGKSRAAGIAGVR